VSQNVPQSELLAAVGPHASNERRSATVDLPKLGSWHLLGRAAHGDWTQVFRARPAGASQSDSGSYALKMVRPELQGDPLAHDLLAREARVAAEVQHPHLIAILEAHVSRGPPFVVMPWLEGTSLEAYARSPRLLDPPVVLWIARQTAEALAALDCAGWRHGDIKPGNIFVSPQGHVTLLDLGFARRRDERLDGPDFLAGSGHYLAPEQAISGGRPDTRSDIYSLGVVLYQLLAGQLPLDGETWEELVAAHKRTAPLPLRRAAPHLPQKVADLVRQCWPRNL
jgi:serine/threonine protein kinase